MINNNSLFCYFFIVFMSCHSCITNGHELVFDPYISAIPDSVSTSEQLSIKKALKEIALNNVTVNGDRYVCHFDRRDFIGMGISGKYCRWLKRQIKDQNRNYIKSLRQNPELRSTVPLEVIFESAKKQYLEHPEMSSETEIIMTDIFQYGTQVNCPEDNIRNLFRNWIDFGAGDGNLKLLSYEYEGVVDNTSRLKKYVRHNHSLRIPSWNYSSSTDANGLHIETMRAKRKTLSSRRYASGALLAHFVSCGDHVFSVKFSYYGKDYEYYIFVKPDTNRVVTMFNIFGFNWLCP